MKIYVSHPTGVDYKTELYVPLRASELSNNHQLILPHEQTPESLDSKEQIKDCHLVLAEVSSPSTGQGIELGWANAYDVPIVCFHKADKAPSDSLSIISDTFIVYKNTEEMIRKISAYLDTL